MLHFNMMFDRNVECFAQIYIIIHLLVAHDVFIPLVSSPSGHTNNPSVQFKTMVIEEKQQQPEKNRLSHI